MCPDPQDDTARDDTRDDPTQEQLVEAFQRKMESLSQSFPEVVAQAMVTQILEEQRRISDRPPPRSQPATRRTGLRLGRGILRRLLARTFQIEAEDEAAGHVPTPGLVGVLFCFAVGVGSDFVVN